MKAPISGRYRGSMNAQSYAIFRMARFAGRHACSGKRRLQKRERAFFSVDGTQCENKKGSGAIQFAFRRSRHVEQQLGKTRPREVEGEGPKGSKVPSEVRLVHWIAIKYLYHYLHFKGALVPASSRVIVDHTRRSFAIRIFFVVDYKSPFLSYQSSARTRAIFAVGLKKHANIYDSAIFFFNELNLAIESITCRTLFWHARIS